MRICFLSSVALLSAFPSPAQAGRIGGGRAVRGEPRAGDVRPLARMPHPGDLLRSAQPIRRRAARGRPGGAEPRPPSGLSEQRLRRRLSGLAAHHRLPVQLHLRRLDGRRRSSPMPGSAPGGSPRRRLRGSVYRPVGLATNYHTTAIHPYWAPSLVPQAVVGAHIFYRRPGQPDGRCVQSRRPPRTSRTRSAGSAQLMRSRGP